MLEDNLFILSKALPKLFFLVSGLNGTCTMSLSFLLPYPHLHFPRLQSSTYRGWCLQGRGWGSGSCNAFRTPVRELPTQQSHPALHLALEQQGEVFETSFRSGSSLALSTWYRAEGSIGLTWSDRSFPGQGNPALKRKNWPCPRAAVN